MSKKMTNKMHGERLFGCVGGMLALALLTLLLSPPRLAVAVDLLHNSADTGSTKWQAQGGWGVTGGKYGQFTCATCHEPNNKSNIKNIRTIVSSMNGENLPNGAPSVPVVYQNITSLGDDSQPHSSSNRICEVCHSQNRFHNSNSANNTQGLGHPNPKEVCTSCHSHTTGFKAACGGCHGNPPTTASRGGDTGLIGTPRPTYAIMSGAAGAHATHVQTRSMVCDTCHYISNGGIKMPNQSGTIQIGFYGFGGKVTSGTYTPYTSLNGYRFEAGTANSTIAPAALTHTAANKCSNVYCHGGGAPGKAPLTGGSNQTPQWDAVGQGNCGNCHGATAANPPTMGSHAKHAGSAAGYAYTCDLCHPAIDISHVQGNVRWQFSATDTRLTGAKYQAAGSGVAANSGTTGGLAPSAAYGQCSNFYCHSNGRGGAANVATPTWGNTTGFAGCSGCHGGAAGSNAPIASNGHTAHTNNSTTQFGGLKLSCAQCHNQVVDSSNTIIGTSLHLNSAKDVDWGTLSSGGASYAANGCNQIYCHSNGKGAYRAPATAWTALSDGSQGTAGCDFCHRGQVAEQRPMSSARHTNHISQSPVGGVRHKAVTCDVCHDNTAAPGGTSIIAGGSHLNKGIDVNFAKFANRSGSYSSGTSQCSNTYCHASVTMTWTSTTINQCGDCHAANNTTAVNTKLSDAHRKHYNTVTLPTNANGWTATNASPSTSGVNIFYCGTCHTTDPENRHINGPAQGLAAAELQITLPFSIPADITRTNTVTRGFSAYSSDGRGYIYSRGTTCDVYCHSDGRNGPSKIAFNWTAVTSSCGNCHNKAGDANPTWSPAHTRHVNTYNGNTNITCNSCHAVTASGNNTLISTRRDRHPNGFRNVTSNTNAGPFSWNGAGCTNTYCHYGTSPNWAGGKLSSRCNSCHGGTAASAPPMTKNAHKAHVNNQSARFNGFNFRCEECHFNTVYSNNTSIKSYTLHANKVKDVNWGPLSTGGGAYNAGACATVYCHSNGQTTLTYKAPTNWTTVADGTEGTVNCDYCHGGQATDTTPINSNRHNNHIKSSPTGGIRHKGVSCDTCHDLTAAPGGTAILASGGNHLNKKIDVNFAKFSNRSGSYSGSATKTCSVTYCHGRNNPVWTTTSINNCSSCHYATNVANGLSGPHAKHYNSGTRPTTTNGWTNTNASTKTAHVFYCGVCHSVNPDTDHVDGPVSQDGASAEIVFNIPKVPANVTRPNSFVYGTSQNQDSAGYFYSTGTTCDVYCHSDGNGGASKTQFVWTGTKFRCGECHNSAFDGAASPTWSLPHTRHIRTYYEGGNANLGCYSCHKSTVFAQNTSIADKSKHVNGYRNISSSSFANFVWNGTTCSTGYCHSDGKTAPNYVSQTWTTLVGGNCTGCHGGAGTANPNGQALTSSHAKHVDPSAYAFVCASCHAKTADPSSNLALKNYTGVKYHVNKTRDVVMSSTYGGTAAGTTPNLTCSTTYCHSNGRGGVPLATATWLTSTSSCTMCHDTKQTGATATQLAGKHNSHMNPTSNASLGAGNGLDCIDCHAKTVSNNTTISGYSKHVNKFIDFSSTHGGGSSRYNTTSKQCTNIYCHSNGNPGAIVYVNMTGNKLWSGSATLGCNGCHGRSNTYAGAPDYSSGGAVPNPAANSHQNHLGATTDTRLCATCHVKTVNKATSGYFKDYTAGKYHLNGTVNVYFDSTKAGPAASFNQGNGQCGNVLCHGATSPVWGANTGTPSCQKCHGYRSAPWNALNGSTATNDAKAGAHFNHISSTTQKYIRPLGCGECHATSIALATDNVNAVGHFDTAAPAELSFGTLAKTGGQTPAYNSPAAGQCSNVYCHGAGLASNISNPPSSRVASPTWSAPFLTGTAGTVGNGSTTPGTGDCSACHGYPPMTATHVGKLATDCTSCHAHVNATGTGFTDATKHINGTVDGGSCNSCHDFDTVGATYLAGEWTGGSWGTNSKDGLTPNEGWGAHAKHINYIKSRLGITTTLNPSGQIFGVGYPANICGSCHTNNVANHTTSGSTVRTINFGDSTFTIGGATGTSFLFGTTNPVYNGTSGISSATTPKTCSNISCHYFTTPIWSTY